MDDFYTAVVRSAEEDVLNALVANREMVAAGRLCTGAAWLLRAGAGAPMACAAARNDFSKDRQGDLVGRDGADIEARGRAQLAKPTCRNPLFGQRRPDRKSVV